MNRELKIRFTNSSGDIEVRETDKCGIVEIMYYWDKNKSGCVIGYWEVVKSDGRDVAEFRSIHSRISETKYDDPAILLDALRFGQKIADILIETTSNISGYKPPEFVVPSNKNPRNGIMYTNL